MLLSMKTNSNLQVSVIMKYITLLRRININGKNKIAEELL